jgi:aryl-alcohol dehydrogenase-like predicted oxidoreductase
LIDFGTKKPIIIGTEIYSRIPNPENEIKEMMRLCSGANILGFDTAPSYGDGYIEKFIGNSLTLAKFDAIVCTKFGQSENHHNKLDLSLVKKQLKESLYNLKRNSIDIYFFHSGTNRDFLQEAIWNHLYSEKERGVIRSLGLSLKHDLVKKNDLIQLSSAKKFGITVLQTVLNPLHQHSLERVIQNARNLDMFIVGRMPLSKGSILELELPEIEKLINYNSEVKQLVVDYWTSRSLPEATKESAIKIGLTLQWCLTHVDAVVLAHRNKDQLLMNFHVMNAINPII